MKKENVIIACILYLLITYCNEHNLDEKITASREYTKEEAKYKPNSAGYDTALYNLKLLQMVHYKSSDKWPVKTVYPLDSAILPFNRIVAYYGNFYSADMGILGID